MSTSPGRGRPVVAVVASGAGSTEPIRPLVRVLSRHVDVRALDRAPTPAAVLAIGSGGKPPDLITGTRDVPRAVVVGDRSEIDGSTVELAGGSTIDTAAWPPLPPHVRRRWRQRLGLAADLVVVTADLDPEDVPTALAVAAAAVVGPDDLPLALALGCPSVTTAEAAAAVGAVDGVHVAVGGRPEAVALAADDRRAALLSRHGRRLATERLDPARTADLLLRAWALAPSGPLARLDERLAELGTAPAAPIRRRVADAVAPLTGSPGGP